jgi:carboxypeptidase D
MTAVNYTYPWNNTDSFDYVDIPNAVNPLTLILNPHQWMNNEQTRDAIHAPHNQIWSVIADYPWNNVAGGSDTSVA